MSIWKITSKGPVKVAETKLRQEKLREEDLEDWIISDPDLLGEPLLIIGRQVLIPDIRDKIDILALDPQGNSVIIELKRGKLRDPVDMQALRYASYISKWGFNDLEDQARNYFNKMGDPEFNFNEMFEVFCENIEIDKIPDLNNEQRIIIVGAEVKDKLGSVALWLQQHSIDIKVIEVEVYREGEDILIQPQIIIPLPVRGFEKTGHTLTSEGVHPWLTDGKSWHLEKRCSAKTRDIFIKLDEIISSKFEVDGPRWNQKFYVAYRVGNYNWLIIDTHSTTLILSFFVRAAAFRSEDIAQRLGIAEYDKAESISQKLGLPSSVQVWNRNQNTDGVAIRLKEEFDLSSVEFLKFLEDAYKAFPK